jgi:NADH-quinone oxidoreductase subunit J
MNAEMILFFMFGAVSLIGAIAVISFRHPIYSALSLIVTFFSQAGLFVLLGAHFVAAVQVIVYAGAIMVLFLFVIMLLNLGTLSAKGVMTGKLKGIAIVLGILLAAEVIYIAAGALKGTAVGSEEAKAAVAAAAAAEKSITTYEIGNLLFSEYLLPFEVTSLILLAALIGVIVLVKRENQAEN